MSSGLVSNPNTFRIYLSSGESLTALRKTFKKQRIGETELHDDHLAITTWEHRDTIHDILSLHRIQHCRFGLIQFVDERVFLENADADPYMLITISRRGEGRSDVRNALWEALWLLVREQYEIQRDARSLIFRPIEENAA